jgi:hypothetical protein
MIASTTDPSATTSANLEVRAKPWARPSRTRVWPGWTVRPAAAIAAPALACRRIATG